MITTVTLNPMLDKTIDVDGIDRGGIKRASAVSSIVGGKGVNVSRQLRLLGCATRATGLLGGEIGMMIERLLKEEGIGYEFVRIAGMTREGVTYREPDGTWTAVFEPPHRVLPSEAEMLVEKCSHFLGDSQWLVCSGSSPGAETDHVFGAIIREAKLRGVNTLLDCYGTAFTQAFIEVPTFTKLNREECEAVSGRKLKSEADYRDVLMQWMRKGVIYGVITDGSRSLFAAGPGGVWRVTPPPVTAVNPTGSGDSLVAGILFGLEHGWTFEECLRFGTAAGAANARRWDVANSQFAEVAKLAKEVHVERCDQSS